MNNQPFGEDQTNQPPSSPPPSPAPDVEKDTNPNISAGLDRADQIARLDVGGVLASRQQLRNAPDSSQEFIANAYAADPVQSPYEQASLQSAKSVGKRKKALIAGAALVILLLAGGGAAAYNYWYQNPQKVITDAVVNMFKAKSFVADGSLVIDYKGNDSDVSKISIYVNSRANSTAGAADAKIAIEADGKKLEFNGSAINDDNANLYVKINDVQKTLDDIVESYSAGARDMIPQSVKDIVKKFDGKWVRISADDLKDNDNKNSKEQECLTDVFNKHEDNQDLQKQLGDAYRNNQFVIIKDHLGSRDGSLGYRIDGDKEKAKGFVNALKETQIYKDIKNCNDSFDINADDIGTAEADDTEVTYEVWVTRFGHQLTQFKTTATDDEYDGDLVINTRFNENVTVEVPSDFISLEDLIADIEKFSSELYGGFDSNVEFNYNDDLEWEDSIDFDSDLDFGIEES